MNIKFIADVYDAGHRVHAVGDVLPLDDDSARWIRRGAAVECADDGESDEKQPPRRGRPPKSA
ncbi:MAG: hypothetical protein AB7J97_12995 [Steroidobacteraceae bacterium]